MQVKLFLIGLLSMFERKINNTAFVKDLKKHTGYEMRTAA